jgi:hypothetical protein
MADSDAIRIKGTIALAGGRAFFVLAGLNRRNIMMKTEISHKELIHAWAPLADVSMALDRPVEKAGSGNANKIIGFMDDKVKRAMVPLKECIERIEKENPDQFS